jgi:hypothetical protein
MVSPHPYLSVVIVIIVLAETPSLLIALALRVCVPRGIILPRQVAAQEVVLGHVARVEPSPATVIDAMPLGSLAVAVILTVPLPL